MGDGVADDESAFHVNRDRRAAPLFGLDSTRRFESVLQSLGAGGRRFPCADCPLADIHRVIVMGGWRLWESWPGRAPPAGCHR